VARRFHVVLAAHTAGLRVTFTQGARQVTRRNILFYERALGGVGGEVIATVIGRAVRHGCFAVDT
jgi:hypothetical protein